MSDIYLQITETPTVVTLSAPVISGALSSTVTVANTVTVALDANSLSALENVTVTVGAAVTISNFPASQAISGTVTIGSLPALAAGTAQIGSVTASISGTVPISISSVTVGNSVTIGSCVTHGVTIANTSVTVNGTFYQATQPVSLTTLPALVAGTAQIGSVTASISGTVPVSGTFFQATQPVSLTTLPALVAGTAQIGSVTASISGTVPISISSVTVGNSVTIGSLPALVAGTAQIGSVTASLAISSSAITSGSFTSLTSDILVPANTARKMATVYNLGAGQLFVNAGATATTLGGGFMVALNAGDFYECNYTTTTLSAIFATAGTASWVSH
jgi:hypothetical protein